MDKKTENKKTQNKSKNTRGIDVAQLALNCIHVTIAVTTLYILLV